MKVMWPPNNKVNESIKKCNSERARKNCVSQRRKWKECNANVFLNRKIQWIPIHLRGHCCLKFSFFLASATEFFFLIRTHECNSGSQWICYFFPFPIVSSIRTFYPLERALRHISIHSIHCISRYWRRIYGSEQWHSPHVSILLLCFVLSSSLFCCSTRVPRAFTFSILFEFITGALAFGWLLSSK